MRVDYTSNKPGYFHTHTLRLYLVVGCTMMGWSIIFTSLRVVYVLGKLSRISPLVDACQTAWASVLESDSEGALLLVQGLISTLEQEEHTVRSHVLENEQVLTQTTSSVLEGMQQCLTRLQLRVKSSYLVSSNAGVAPRHLLITKQLVSATGTPSQRRIMYHRAAAQTLKGTSVASVECLDQLYFQVAILQIYI